MNDNLIVEVARQSGEQWVDRLLMHPRDVRRYADSYPKEAIFKTTFTLHTDKKVNEIQDTGKEFEVLPKSGDLFFDFDNHDIALAREDCHLTYQYLTNVIQIEPEAVAVYQSGGKGYHLLVQWEATGLEPRSDLHLIYRKFATSLGKHVTKNNTLDVKVYNSRRLFRVPLTKHQKTGNLKVRIDPASLANPEGVATIAEKAWGKASTDEALHKALTDIQTLELEVQDVKQRLPLEFLHEPLDCIAHVLNSGAGEGKRNDTAYTVSLYFRGCGLSQDDARRRLLASALHTKSGMEEQEIRRTVESAYRSKHTFGLRDSVISDLISHRDQQRWRSARIEEDYESYNQVAEQYLAEVRSPHRKVARYFVTDLDKRMGGIRGGELVVLGGTTGTGKSEFAFHVAFENAKSGTPSAFITLEVDNQHFIARQVRALTGISGHRIFDGDLTELEKQKVEEALKPTLRAAPSLYFRRRKSLMTSEELEKIVQTLIVEQQCRLVVIDHLHYLASNKKYESENQSISAAIRAINSIAVRYNVGIICVAHFRKQQDPLHKPSLHEFRDSSAIEQEASSVLILWRDRTSIIASDQYITEFCLAKTRKDIPLFTVATRFNPDTRQYDELKK